MTDLLARTALLKITPSTHQYNIWVSFNEGMHWNLMATVADEKSPVNGTFFLAKMHEEDRCRILEQLWQMIGKRRLHIPILPPEWWTESESIS